MRRLAATLTVALALAGCQALPHGPEALPQTFIPDVSPPPVDQAIVTGFTDLERVALRVRVRTCTEYGTGTAWMLDETHAVTNKHVVEGATDVTLTGYDGRTYAVKSSVIDKEADLALVTIEGTFPEAAVIATAEPAVGTMLTVSGYPNGEALVTRTGRYDGEVPDELETTDDPVYSARIETHPGNSGSPIANADGEVVGVVYASDDVSWTLAMSLPTLQAFLDDESRHGANTADCDL